STARAGTSNGRSPAESSTCSRAGRSRARGPDRMPGAAIGVVHGVSRLDDLNKRELGQVARLFKERRFAEGETVAKEGAGGAAFFLIDWGEATVTLAGKPRATLRPGDYFGEIALIDGGARSATVTASTELV